MRFRGERAAGKAQALAADPTVEKPRKTGRPKDGESPDFKADQHSSTSAQRIVRRLKRDAPEVAEALARGEYPSARSAGIAAGIVKVPSALDILRRAWSRASHDERDDIALIRRIVAADVEATNLLDAVLQRPAGNPTFGAPIVDNVNDSGRAERPTGNSAERALRKLRKDAPTLVRSGPVALSTFGTACTQVQGTHEPGTPSRESVLEDALPELRSTSERITHPPGG